MFFIVFHQRPFYLSIFFIVFIRGLLRRQSPTLLGRRRIDYTEQPLLRNHNDADDDADYTEQHFLHNLPDAEHKSKSLHLQPKTFLHRRLLKDEETINQSEARLEPPINEGKHFIKPERLLLDDAWKTLWD